MKTKPFLSMNRSHYRQVLDCGDGVGEVTALASMVARLRTPAREPVFGARHSCRFTDLAPKDAEAASMPRSWLRRTLILLLLCAWPGASTAQGAIGYAVGAWGDNTYGQVTGTRCDPCIIAEASSVTLGGQILSGVAAIGAGMDHTVALIDPAPLLPYLNARPSGNELILSWPTNAVGFALQSTLNLTPPVTWIDSTKSPAVIGAYFSVTSASSGSAQFYRLRRP